MLSRSSAIQEKRQHIRIPSSRPVVCIIDKQNIYATMTDFSEHGIGFMSSQPAQREDFIEVHFDVALHPQSSELRPFQFKAEVKHCMSYNQQHHIGVRLDLPTEEYMHLFKQHAGG